MTFEGFEDVYIPETLMRAMYRSTPRTSTTIVTVASGHEHRNRNYVHPLWKFTAPEGVTCHEQIEDLKDHWLAMSGPHIAFPFRDLWDFASCRLEAPGKVPALNITDQVLGVGDGATTVFPLIKTYTRGSRTYARLIELPVVETVIVGANAVEVTNWNVTREGGDVTFDTAPDDGVIVTAGYLFDVPSRFESDEAFDMVIKSYQVDEFAELTFLEVRVCELTASS